MPRDEKGKFKIRIPLVGLKKERVQVLDPVSYVSQALWDNALDKNFMHY